VIQTDHAVSYLAVTGGALEIVLSARGRVRIRLDTA
jgi:hypothetical protein